MVRVVVKPAGILMIVAALGVLAFLAFKGNPKQEPSTPETPRAAPNLATATVTNSSLLQNGGFEGAWHKALAVPTASKAKISGEIGDSWLDNSDWGNLTLTYARENTGAHGGGACQRVDIGAIAPSGGQLQFVQQLPNTPKQRYQATVWVKASKSGIPCTLQLRQAGQPYTVFASQNAQIGDNWQQMTITGPATTIGGMYLMVICPRANVTLWIDDATLTRVD